jgi:hypothetical protein
LSRIAVAAVLAAPLLISGCTDAGTASRTETSPEGTATTKLRVVDNNIAIPISCPGGTGMRRAPYEAAAHGASSPMSAAQRFIRSGPGARPGDYGSPGPRIGRNLVDITVIHQSHVILHEVVVVKRHGQWFVEAVKECASPQSRR